VSPPFRALQVTCFAGAKFAWPCKRRCLDRDRTQRVGIASRRAVPTSSRRTCWSSHSPVVTDDDGNCARKGSMATSLAWGDQRV